MTTTDIYPTLSTTVSAGTMMDALDVSIAATTERVSEFKANGQGTKAELKREVERLFGIRAFISNVIGPRMANGQSDASRLLFDRICGQWDTLSALQKSF